MSDTPPRPEHPRPQLVRDTWVNLNGPWTFRLDPGKSGVAQGWAASTGFDREITVPFCPESRLSGVGHTDFIEAMWYHRKLDIPAGWAGKAVLLHFGAVDHEAEVFLDGRRVGAHVGGCVGFTVDLSAHARPGGTHDLVVRVADDTRSGDQPLGKQSKRFGSHGCHYTRTTGIWQTVWLEAVDPRGIRSVHLAPDLDHGRLFITPRVHRQAAGLTWSVTTTHHGVEIEEQQGLVEGVPLVLHLHDPRPWSPADPHLYNLTVRVRDAEGNTVDEAASYAGLRKVEARDGRVFLNGQPVFQRLVLDQGFYPEGIWTAPSDEALKRDIELSMAAGFNGARLHEKVFEPRFHYHADRLGYLTWGEFSDWGVQADGDAAVRSHLEQWSAIVERDRNHPSIIAWTPGNEVWKARGPAEARERYLTSLYDLTKRLDPTRPVNTAAGGPHPVCDIFTAHNYQQDPPRLREALAALREQDPVGRSMPEPLEPGGRPLILDEYGGIKWNPDQGFEGDREQSWGYGDAPRTEAEFLDRLKGLTDAIIDDDQWAGYCYTQLTDVEQEQNGVYFYDRSPKFDAGKIAPIFGRKPDWSA